jgi:paraquat-inducible protein B
MPEHMPEHIPEHPRSDLPDDPPEDPRDDQPEDRFAFGLYEVLDTLADGNDVASEDAIFLQGADVRTFRDEELLTGRPGVVVHARDGISYQIPVIRSR